jgi:hypothetical protein
LLESLSKHFRLFANVAAGPSHFVLVNAEPVPPSLTDAAINMEIESLALWRLRPEEKALEHRDNNRRALSIFTRQYLTPDSGNTVLIQKQASWNAKVL